MKQARPRVMVSKCLGFEACRYNGEVIPNHFLRALEPHVELLTVCPEVEIGLGTPREPVRLVSPSGSSDDLQLVQPATERDLSQRMKHFANRFLGSLKNIDGFVLKSASPSCGVKDARYHSSAAGGSFRKGPGMFARVVLQRFPHVAVEDEGRLTNLRLREHFLARIFTMARLRAVKENPSILALVRFQTTHKLLLKAYSQKALRDLDRIVANQDRQPLKEVVARYEKHLYSALVRAPRYVSNINVLMHALGYVSDRLTAREKAHFLDLLQKYREHRLALSTPVGVLKSWLIRFDVESLLQQVYFEPFPEALVSLLDRPRGRAVK